VSANIDTEWSLDGSDGDLMIRTGVDGVAAAMGHRLTLAMRQWRATTKWDVDEPVYAELTVEAGSLEVVRGEGGVTPLTGPEKILVRSNAVKSLDAKHYPRITFVSNDIEKTADGYRLTGTLTIHDISRPQVVDLRVEDQGGNWWLSSETTVTQSEFGIKPYSQLLGSLRVADDVTVAFAAKRAKQR
jgi:polyisoprenoid-binding protein YceI